MYTSFIQNEITVEFMHLAKHVKEAEENFWDIPIYKILTGVERVNRVSSFLLQQKATNPSKKYYCKL